MKNHLLPAFFAIAALAAAQQPMVSSNDGNLEFLVAAGKTVTFKNSGSCSGSGGSGAMGLATEKFVTDSVSASVNQLKADTATSLANSRADLVSSIVASATSTRADMMTADNSIMSALRMETSMAVEKMASQLRAEWSTASVPPPPPPLPRTCFEISRANPFSPSGIYTIKPSATLPAFSVYCDMTNYNGGWTLIQVFNAGKFALTKQDMLEMYFNPNDVGGSYLGQPNVPTFPMFASWGEAKMNALGAASFGPQMQGPVVRVDFLQCDDNPASVGIYFQQKDTVPADWSLYRGLRDALYWGNNTGNGVYVDGFGASFQLTKGPEGFIGWKNEVTHNTCGDGSFGYFSAVTAKVLGRDVFGTKHFGLLNDGHCGQGNQWLGTLDPADGRFGSDNTRRSLLWVR